MRALLRPSTGSPTFHLLPQAARAGTIGALLFFCATLSFPADALVLPDDGQVAGASIQLASEAFPSGGVVVGEYQCSDCSLDDFVFTDESGAVISGTFLPDPHERAGHFIWLADSALPPGSYSITLTDSFGDGQASFIVVQASDELPSMTAKMNEQLIGAGEPLDCGEWADQPTPWPFWENTLTAASLFVEVTGPTATQYSYEVSVDGGAPEPMPEGTHRVVESTEARNICVEVTVTSLVDGTSTSLPTECQDTTLVEDLGQETDTSLGQLELTLRECTVPPEGYEEEWCAYHAPASEQHSCNAFRAEPCEAARQSCGDGDGGDGASPDSDQQSGQSASCSLVAPSQRALSAWLWLIASFLIFSWRRRRRAPVH